MYKFYNYSSPAEGTQPACSTTATANDFYGRNAYGGFHGLPRTPSPAPSSSQSEVTNQGCSRGQSPLKAFRLTVPQYDPDFDPDVPVPSIEGSTGLLTPPSSEGESGCSGKVSSSKASSPCDTTDQDSDNDSDSDFEQAQARESARLELIQKKLREFEDARNHCPPKASRQRVTKSPRRKTSGACATKPSRNEQMTKLGVPGQLRMLALGFLGVNLEELGIEDDWGYLDVSMATDEAFGLDFGE